MTQDRKVKGGYGVGALNIKEFKVEDMVINPAIVIIAKRGSGKSWVCRAILKALSSIPGGIIISKTEKVNPFYKDWFPDMFIFDEFSPSILSRLLSRQRAMIKKEKQKKAEGKFVDARVFLLMDDCLSDKGSWAKDKNVSEVMLNGRHYQITYMLTMQYVIGIGPDLRSNFDYIFILMEDQILNLEKIWKNFAGVFPSFDSFRTVFDSCTEDHGCMVINNRISSRKLDEKVFWFKAGPEEPDALGSDKFRDYGKKYYDPEYEDRQNQFDFSTLMPKRKKCSDLVVMKVGDGDE